MLDKEIFDEECSRLDEERMTVCSGCNMLRPVVELCLVDNCNNTLCDFCLLNDSGILGICFDCSVDLTDEFQRVMYQHKTIGIRVTLRCYMNFTLVKQKS